MGEILSFEELQNHKYINMECYHPPTSHLPRDLIVLYCMTLNLSYPVRMEGGQGRTPRLSRDLSRVSAVLGRKVPVACLQFISDFA